MGCHFLAWALGLVLALAAPARAEPALWAVKDHGATVYLFGTVHMLQPETRWKAPKIAAAFDAATDFWFELEEDVSPSLVRPLFASLGVDPAHPLSSKFSAADITRIDAAAKAAGMPGEMALEPMRPWLAATILGLALATKAGFDPHNGVDNLLRADARQRGKHIYGFETIEQQVRFLAELPVPVQREMLLSTLDDYEAGAAQVGEIVDDWAKGDVEALGALLLRDMNDNHYPVLYRNLVVRRNQTWADRIARQLHSGKPSTSFVAVGAAHLAGPDSLLIQLEKRGFKPERQ
jgi:uncharacterized protein YbaP (TraB family)